MNVIEQQFAVRYQYRTYFTQGLLAPANSLLAEVLATPGGPVGCLAVVDAGVAAAHPQLLAQLTAYAQAHPQALAFRGAPLVVPGGEAAKNDTQWVEMVLAAINDRGICRHSYVLAIGGGAVLDMVGFAAAIAHRGVRLLRVPTTVLAQNDSGVGVKNSFNYFGKKNFLGTFQPPVAVLNDADFLTTLDDRDWRAGMAEAIKVALIKDRAFFEQIEADVPRLNARHLPTMQAQIYRCAELHIRHIGQGGDAFEGGSSRPLDFGHWAAHKLEQLTHHQLRHGEAVAIGIALDVTYSHLIGWLPQPDWQRVLALLARLGFALFVPELAQQLHQPQHPASLLSGLQEFREHLGGQLTIMLLEGLGRGREVHEIDLDLMRQAIGLLPAYQAQAHEHLAGGVVGYSYLPGL
ncbi:MAG: 3-dehydroquinate synthase [Bernardetiaceae bacterium]|nr:3-dehydroquinate synthase [Bernardetiaceae bacterium]